MSEFQEALERVVAGPERKSRIISDAEKVIIAYHEGGHAVVQRILPKCDPVSKVTIISRGMALGYTMALPTEDRYLQSKSEFEDKIAGLLGGNASEKLIFGDTTTGRVQRHREGDRPCPPDGDRVRHEREARPALLRQARRARLPRPRDRRAAQLLRRRRQEIDEEVRAIIDNAYARAMDVLTRHKDKLVLLAEKLVAEETVDAEEFEKLFNDIPPKADVHGSAPRLVGQPTQVPAPTPSPA